MMGLNPANRPPPHSVLFSTSGIFAFVGGILWVQQLTHLPGFELIALLWLFATLLACRQQWTLMLLVAGLAWASSWGYWQKSQMLPDGYQGVDVEIVGVIATLPKLQEQRLSFDFKVQHAPPDFPTKIRLSWYSPPPNVKAGQQWRVTVKLKKPHGLANPGGFDYEQWLFANGIGATGYIRKPPPQLLVDGGSWGFLAWRQQLAQRLDQVLAGSDYLGLVKALVIGNGDSISQAQWRVFRKTGTIHLVVISGSHVSLLAGLAYWLALTLWRRVGGLRYSPQRVAVIVAGIAAFAYGGLAGFTIPVQRALVMLAVGLAAIYSQRAVAPSRALLLALFAVTLYDPLAVLSAGFWLSFLTVALLGYAATHRAGEWWLQIGRLHLLIAVGLAPTMLFLFEQVSIISPLANAVAIPVIELLAVPLALSATGLLFIAPSVASGLFGLLEWVLAGLYRLLELGSQWSFAVLNLPSPPLYSLLLASLGLLLCFAPKGIPARYLGLVCCLPLLFNPPARLNNGEARMSLLDVGQGLAMVVETAKHVLVFDTGAKFSEDSDIGERVLLPFLHHQGVNAVDTLIVSHGDNDHIGGADSLIAAMPIATMRSSVPAQLHPAAGLCQAGQNWQWDGVMFTLLSPSLPLLPKENDNSCVLQITTRRHRWLLTGDIEQAAETALVQRYGENLRSDVLIAPHHGSKTSSTWAFLNAVQPDWVFISAGHQNRFKFPNASVIARYQQLGIRWLNTAEQGAITATGGESLQIDGFRDSQVHYWQ